MAPVAVAQDSESRANGTHKEQNGHTGDVELPMKSNGSLDGYTYNDLTPCIGREFPTANLVDIMNAPNADELLAELALTSRRYRLT
jgi:hypothetical protein